MGKLTGKSGAESQPARSYLDEGETDANAVSVIRSIAVFFSGVEELAAVRFSGLFPGCPAG